MAESQWKLHHAVLYVAGPNAKALTIQIGTEPRSAKVALTSQSQPVVLDSGLTAGKLKVSGPGHGHRDRSFCLWPQSALFSHAVGCRGAIVEGPTLS